MENHHRLTAAPRCRQTTSRLPKDFARTFRNSRTMTYCMKCKMNDCNCGWCGPQKQPSSPAKIKAEYSQIINQLIETMPFNESISRDLDLLVEASEARHGEDQTRIAETIIQWGALLLRKNKDYGNSVWNTPVLAPDCSVSAAIRVRMSDKISRLAHLIANNNDPAINESIDDTLRDLGAYCLLELARPKK
jgi:hypothetical protein